MARSCLIGLLIAVCSVLYGTSIQGTITLHNDTPYILTATVYTRSGEYLGQIRLQPGQQSNFVSNLYSTYLNRPGSPNASITPYRVIWQCADGGVYSTVADASVGAFVRASDGQGLHICQPKEEKPKKEKPLVTPPGSK